MQTVDDVLDHMAARDVGKAVLIGDSPMRLYAATGEAVGPTISTDDLVTIARDEMPAPTWDAFQSTGRAAFGHPSRHGQYFLRFTRDSSGMQLRISRIPGIVVRLAGLLMLAVGLGLTAFQIEWAHRTGRYFPAVLVMGPALGFIGLPFLILGPMKDKDVALRILVISMVVGAVIGLGVLGLFNMGMI